MKSKCNLFGLLSRGVTTTHPLCSVFILSLLFCFCFSSVSANAAISNIPEMSDWQFQQAIDAYTDLSDDQKDIANFLAGSQGYAFAGIAQSNLNTNFSSYDDTIQHVKDYGKKMWDQIDSFSNGVVNGMVGVTNNLSNFLGNAVTYAKTRSESFSAWLGNVGIDYNSSSEFRVQFGKDQAQDNIDFYGEQGLYNWQFSQDLLNPADFPFTWDTRYTSKPTAYWNYYNSMPLPRVKANRYHYSSVSDSYLAGSFFSTYNIIFANLSTQKCYLVDSSGNRAPSNAYVFMCGLNSGSFISNNSYVISHHEFDIAAYTNLYDLYLYLSAYSGALITDNWSASPYEVNFVSLADFVVDLRVGYSFDGSVPWTRDFDLNLSSTSQYTTVNSPTNIIYLDLNGFMRDLYDNPTIIYNYVINNSVDPSGNPVTSGDFDPISKYINIPKSGINIGIDFFKLPDGTSPLFDTYIADLWRNTKDMVLYCGDILKVFTLDGGGGLAYVVYGAIGVGVIGGIFSKFLL